MNLLGKEATPTNSIIILGGSKMGRNLAEELQKEMSVRLIEKKRDKAEWLASQVKDTMIIHGDGTDVELLKSENIQDADSFIAVTESEQTNLLSGMLAHHLGVTFQNVQKYEVGKIIPTAYRLKVIADYFKIKADDLLDPTFIHRSTAANEVLDAAPTMEAVNGNL